MLARIITLNGLSGCSYFEPFAGGAGAALRLLRERVVDELHLNDLDPRIHAFWHAALNEPERFADTIRSVPLDLDEWNRQKRSYADRDHRRLASYVLRQRVFKWVISYDDTSFIRKLYRDCAVHHLPVRYCLQRKRRAGELLVASSGVRLPDSILPGSSNRENGGAVAERRGG